MELAVTGLGMITPLGRTAESACAALRAGIVRAHELAGSGEEGGANSGIRGHTLSPYADGFVQLGFWVRVGVGCLRDLVRYGGLPMDRQFWERTCVIATIPVLDEERFHLPADDADGLVRDHFLRPALMQLGGAALAAQLAVVEEGRSGAARALALADEALAGGRVDRAVVLAVDSLCDPFSLAWLAERGSLKTDDEPAGMSPGEAGACFLVESRHAAAERHARVDAVVSRWALDDRDEYDVLDPARIARAIARSARAVLGGSPERFRGDLYLDLNGLSWRAMAWGNAQIDLQQRIDLGSSRQILLASSLGDVGAAFAPIAVCAAARSFARGYCRGRAALVIGVDDFGDTSAILIHAAP
jgi:3-oxoacyl-[acyl-carrier-protein] synthase-1